MQPRPSAPTLTPAMLRSVAAMQLELERPQRAIARQHLSHTGVGFAPLADRGDEFAVLQLDAIDRYVHLRHVDPLVLAVQQFVIARDVGAVVADVAEEGA